MINETDATLVLSQNGVSTEVGALGTLVGPGSVVVSWDEPSAAAQGAKYVLWCCLVDNRIRCFRFMSPCYAQSLISDLVIV